MAWQSPSISIRRRGIRRHRRRHKGRPRCQRRDPPGTGAGRDASPRSGSTSRPSSGGRSSYLTTLSTRPSSWIRACSRTRSSVRSVEPSRGGTSGSGSAPSCARVCHAPLHEAAPLLASDARDQAEVVVDATPRLALDDPAADVAMLDWIGVGSNRRVGRGRSVWSQRLFEALLRGAVVGHEVVDAEATVSWALPPSATWSHSG